MHGYNYVPLTGHITIWHIFKGKIKVWGANHKTWFSQSMFKPLNCRVWHDSSVLCLKQMLQLNELTQAKSCSLVVTCTTGCTCHHEVTLHRNQWNKSEKKRLNTNWNFVVSSDQWCTWLCRLLGLAKRVSGIMAWGPPTLSPVSLFDSGR